MRNFCGGGSNIARFLRKGSDVPAHLLRYKNLFVYQQLQQEVGLGEDFDAVCWQRWKPTVVKAKRLTLTARFIPLFKAAAVIAIILSLGNVAQHSFSGDDGSVLATDTIGKQVTAPSVAISNDVKAEQVLADSLAKMNGHKVQVINE